MQTTLFIAFKLLPMLIHRFEPNEGVKRIGQVAQPAAAAAMPLISRATPKRAEPTRLYLPCVLADCPQLCPLLLFLPV